MKTPGFWYGPDAQSFWGRTVAALLSPAGKIYGAVTAARMKRRPTAELPLPVICIGNLTAGGAGKTPTAIAIMGLLNALNRNGVFLTRGYKGALEGPVWVDVNQHDATQIGDEPLLLAQYSSTLVSRDRTKARSLLDDTATDGHNFILMDDGLQSPAVRKNLRFAVVDTEAGIGNGRCVPAGPLRAPVQAQLPQIDAFIALSASPEMSAVLPFDIQNKPVFRAHIAAQAHTIGSEKVCAFTGLGRPGKFFVTLRENGIDVEERLVFGDHHLFSRRDLERIASLCERKKLVPVTTEKDAMRLKALDLPEPLKSNLQILKMIVQFERPNALTRFILDRTLLTAVPRRSD